MWLSNKQDKPTNWHLASAIALAVLAYWGMSAMPTELERRVAEGEVYVYFVRDGADDFTLAPVRRDAAKDQTAEQVLDFAIRELLVGPNGEEKATGLISGLPVGLKLISARIDHDTAVLEFDKDPESGIFDGTVLAEIITQIERTSFGIPGVRRVIWDK